MSHGQPGCNFWLSTRIFWLSVSCHNLKQLSVTNSWSECSKFVKNNSSQILLLYIDQFNSFIRFEPTNMLKKLSFGCRVWLSAGQLEHYFRLSAACFGCHGQMDNHYFEHWWRDPQISSVSHLQTRQNVVLTTS